MKNNVLFALISLVSLSSCDLHLSDEDLATLKPYGGNLQGVNTTLVNGKYRLVQQVYGWGDNYHFVVEGSPTDLFLFNVCTLDCNESLQKTDWDKYTNTFYVYITAKFKSGRFETQNRLILYQVKNDTPVKLLDTVKEVYKTFRFEDKKFIYTLQDGTERSIELK